MSLNKDLSHGTNTTNFFPQMKDKISVKENKYFLGPDCVKTLLYIFSFLHTNTNIDTSTIIDTYTITQIPRLLQTLTLVTANV